MKIFGMNVIESTAVPKDRVFILPPWINDVRLVNGVLVRFREGKAYPLTDDELRQIGSIGNIKNDQ